MLHFRADILRYTRRSFISCIPLVMATLTGLLSNICVWADSLHISAEDADDQEACQAILYSWPPMDPAQLARALGYYRSMQALAELMGGTAQRRAPGSLPNKPVHCTHLQRESLVWELEPGIWVGIRRRLDPVGSESQVWTVAVPTPAAIQGQVERWHGLFTSMYYPLHTALDSAVATWSRDAMHAMMARRRKARAAVQQDPGLAGGADLVAAVQRVIAELAPADVLGQIKHALQSVYDWCMVNSVVTQPLPSEWPALQAVPARRAHSALYPLLNNLSKLLSTGVDAFAGMAVLIDGAVVAGFDLPGLVQTYHQFHMAVLSELYCPPVMRSGPNAAWITGNPALAATLQHDGKRALPQAPIAHAALALPAKRASWFTVRSTAGLCALQHNRNPAHRARELTAAMERGLDLLSTHSKAHDALSKCLAAKPDLPAHAASVRSAAAHCPALCSGTPASVMPASGRRLGLVTAASSPSAMPAAAAGKSSAQATRYGASAAASPPSTVGSPSVEAIALAQPDARLWCPVLQPHGRTKLVRTFAFLCGSLAMLFHVHVSQQPDDDSIEAQCEDVAASMQELEHCIASTLPEIMRTINGTHQVLHVDARKLLPHTTYSSAGQARMLFSYPLPEPGQPVLPHLFSSPGVVSFHQANEATRSYDKPEVLREYAEVVHNGPVVWGRSKDGVTSVVRGKNARYAAMAAAQARDLLGQTTHVAK